MKLDACVVAVALVSLGVSFWTPLPENMWVGLWKFLVTLGIILTFAEVVPFLWWQP